MIDFKDFTYLDKNIAQIAKGFNDETEYALSLLNLADVSYVKDLVQSSRGAEQLKLMVLYALFSLVERSNYYYGVSSGIEPQMRNNIHNNGVRLFSSKYLLSKLRLKHYQKIVYSVING